jgi:serine/threonine protein kinase
VSAIDHCHLSGVLHRDLKLENILLSAEKHILITDFGLGRSYQVRSAGLHVNACECAGVIVLTEAPCCRVACSGFLFAGAEFVLVCVVTATDKPGRPCCTNE